jgi:Leucine-rich repeat (LRR) protein
LETLILSHNQLSSTTSIFNPQKHFLAFSSLPRLKRLDLSHNYLTGLHLDELLLKSKRSFRALVELDLSYNRVQRQEALL